VSPFAKVTIFFPFSDAYAVYIKKGTKSLFDSSLRNFTFCPSHFFHCQGRSYIDYMFFSGLIKACLFIALLPNVNLAPRSSQSPSYLYFLSIDSTQRFSKFLCVSCNLLKHLARENSFIIKNLYLMQIFTSIPSRIILVYLLKLLFYFG
jgi:hypothetical protein